MWEAIPESNHLRSSARLRVPGGWLVRVSMFVDALRGPGVAIALQFVSDPAHTWELEKAEKVSA